MGKVVFILALLCTITISTCQDQYRPIARLYSNTGCNGSYLSHMSTNIPTLQPFGFDNYAQSVRLTGTWLFFDLKFFNPQGRESMEYNFKSKDTCVDFAALGRRVSSLKIAGHSADYRYDSINFYEYTYFQGREEYVTYDVPNLSSAGYQESFIITGSSDWTIYDRTYYGGNALCLTIKEPPYYEPAFVSDIKQLNIPYGSIASVRLGCLTTNVLFIDVYSSSGTHNNLTNF